MRIDTISLDAMLNDARDIVLVGHFNPDGDALGSVTAAYHYLKARGMYPHIILPSPYPENMSFLEPDEPSGRMVIVEDSPETARQLVRDADTIICLDLNKLSRTEYLEQDILGSKAKKVLIDHHIQAEHELFDLVIATVGISSTCELLFWIIMSMPDVSGDVLKIGMRCAESLYIGMMTDTNNFSNSVYPSTFEMASKLMERGVDKDRLQEKVLSCYSESRTRLMGHLIKDNMRILHQWNAAYITLTNKEKDEYEFKAGDSEGFVNIPLSISNVMISALFTENYDGRYIRVSLRSKGDINVNSLAVHHFNGGGHRNASGGRLYIPMEDVPAYFENALELWSEEEKFSQGTSFA